MSRDQMSDALAQRLNELAVHASNLDVSERLLVEVEYGVEVFDDGIDGDRRFLLMVEAEQKLHAEMNERQIFDRLIDDSLHGIGWLLEVNDGEIES